MAAFPGSTSVVVPGYQPGAVSSRHQQRHLHSLSHSHPAVPRPPQHFAHQLEQHVDDDLSSSYTISPNNYTTAPQEELEAPPVKRLKTGYEEDMRRAANSSKVPDQPRTTAGRQVYANDLVTGPRTMERRTTVGHVTGGPTKAGGTGAGGGSGPATVVPVVASSKPKRVRTGCLTCRERHLKCDEGTPDCLNCRKSNRECRRGVRLNFIDIQVKSPPYIPPAVEWSVQFQDESRLIASEYQGGLGLYTRLDHQDITPPRETDLEAVLRQQTKENNSGPNAFIDGGHRTQQIQGARGLYYSGNMQLPNHVDFSGYEGSQQQNTSRKNSDAYLSTGPGPSLAAMHLNTGTGAAGAGFSLLALQDQHFASRGELAPGNHNYKSSDVSSVASSLVPQGVAPSSSESFQGGPGGTGLDVHDALIMPEGDKATGERDFLNSEEEIHYMHVFIEEVGVWMDSLDNNKHFSRIIPYLALKSPMLLNAFLACGVKHLTLVNSQYNDDRALFYYDTATTQLLRSLQNPDRNTAECATTAVVLNVYEIMSEKPTARMSHIAGARALIRECGWNAKSTGIGAACFWLNIGMEVLSCLAFNWQTAWDPDQWGLDMDVLLNMEDGNADGAGRTDRMDLGGGGAEELWVHRIFYIVAKIANFRANIPRFQEPSPHDEQVRLQSRYTEWKRLRGLCDTWNSNCPRPMRPYGYAPANQSRTGSAFPNIWLIKRAAVIGRLYYHTAMCLLAQIDPLSSRDNEQNRTIQIHHAHQVCGIVAHTKDRGVASVAIRSLAIASSVLTKRHEQEEVIDILDRINKETGWRLGKVHDELKKAWGWEGVAAPGAPLPIPQPTQKGHGSSSAPIAKSFLIQRQQQQQQAQHQAQATGSGPVPMVTATAAAPVQAPRPRPLVNPLLAQADFNLPNHPYQNWYEPPNRSNAAYNSQGFWPTQ